MKSECGGAVDDTEEVQQRLARIDKSLLAPIVARSLGTSDFTVAEWGIDILKSRMASDRGMVCRVEGVGREPGQGLREWSLILKIGRGIDRGKEPRGENLRETEFYRTGVAEGVPGGFRAPVCWGVTDMPNDMPWVWLEDVKGEDGNRWSMERKGLAAFHLGQFQGAYLAGRPLPSAPLFDTKRELSADTIHCVDNMMPGILENLAANPLTRPTYGAHLGERLNEMTRQSRGLLRLLERAPITFCHRDFGPGNVLSCKLADGNEQTVGLDWDFCGTGQVGLETQSFISCFSVYQNRPVREVKELTELVVENYICGLADAGWKGDPGTIRFACYALLAMQGSFHLAIHVNMQLGWGVEDEAEIDNYAEIQHYLLDLLHRAREYEKCVGSLTHNARPQVRALPLAHHSRQQFKSFEGIDDSSLTGEPPGVE